MSVNAPLRGRKRRQLYRGGEETYRCTGGKKKRTRQVRGKIGQIKSNERNA